MRWSPVLIQSFCHDAPQEAEAFALYHRALDLQKHDKFEESAKAYHELLKTPLLKEVHMRASACELHLALNRL